VLKALEVASAINAAEKVNALVSASAADARCRVAVMAAKGENRVESATFLASMLDFFRHGRLGLFIDESGVALREAAIGKGGIMPGRDLALVFSALRANDLVWSYVISNYLEGQVARSFRLLYWMRIPPIFPDPCMLVRAQHLFETACASQGRRWFLGVPVDLGKITVPAYVLATRETTSALRTAYRTNQLLGARRASCLERAGTSPEYQSRLKISAATG